MQVNKANFLIFLGLFSLVFNLVPSTQTNLSTRENFLGYVQTIDDLEQTNSFLVSEANDSPKGEVGEGRRDKERASGRGKIKAVNNV